MKKRTALLSLCLCFVFCAIISCKALPRLEEDILENIASFIKGPEDIENQEYIGIKKTGNMTFARSQLSKEMKEYYDLLDQYVYKFIKEIDKIRLHKDEFQKLIEHYRADNPQAFWLTSAYQYRYDTENEQIISAQLSFSYAANIKHDPVDFTEDEVIAMTREMDAAAAGIIESMEEYYGRPLEDLGEYDIILFFHDYLASNVVYDDSYPLQHTAYGALVGNRAVCDGYATALQYLLGKSGIECTIVYGDDREDNPESHAWNMVKVDDAYYHLDVTWDIPPEELDTPIYANFLSSEALIERRHIIFSPLEGEDPGDYPHYPVIPRAESDALWFYQQTGTYIEDASDASMKQLVYKANEAVAGKEQLVQFCFKDNSDLLYFIDEVQKGPGKSQIRRQFPYGGGNTGYQTRISYLDEEQIVLLQFSYE